MAPTHRAISDLYYVSLVKRQKCAGKYDTSCSGFTRLALVMPLLDIGEDESLGLGSIAMCGSCMTTAIRKIEGKKPFPTP